MSKDGGPQTDPTIPAPPGFSNVILFFSLLLKTMYENTWNVKAKKKKTHKGMATSRYHPQGSWA